MIVFSYFWPPECSDVWDKPYIHQDICRNPINYLPDNTIKMAYSYKKAKGRCPVSKETTKAWTEIERERILAEAVEVTTTAELQAKVCTEVNSPPAYLHRS